MAFVEYSLRTTIAPIVVAAYRVREALAPGLQQGLPNPSELKAVVEEEKQRLLAQKARGGTASPARPDEPAG